MLGFLQAPRTARSRPPSCACTPMTLPRDVRPSWHRRVCSAANSPPLRVWVSLWVLVTCSFWKFSTFFFFFKVQGKGIFPELKDVASATPVGGGRAWTRRTKEPLWNGDLGRTTKDSKNWVQTLPSPPHLPNSSWIWNACGSLPGHWLPLNHPNIAWSPFSPA